MSTVILHIGAGKTGSTAIQHALSFNTRRLEEAGFIYPRILNVTRKPLVSTYSSFIQLTLNQLHYSLTN